MRATQYKAIKKSDRALLAWGQANGFIDFAYGKWWTLNMSGGLAEEITRRAAIDLAAREQLADAEGGSKQARDGVGE